MKHQKTIQYFFCFSFLLMTYTQGYGQCKNFVKSVDFTALNSFEYCDEVKVAQMYSDSEAKLRQKLESNKRYRILAEAQSHIGDLSVAVINQKGDTVSMEVTTKNQRYWEVRSQKKEKVEIQLNFRKSATTGINAAGCVVLAIGEMENESLVNR